MMRGMVCSDNGRMRARPPGCPPKKSADALRAELSCKWGSAWCREAILYPLRQRAVQRTWRGDAMIRLDFGVDRRLGPLDATVLMYWQLFPITIRLMLATCKSLAKLGRTVMIGRCSECWVRRSVRHLERARAAVRAASSKPKPSASFTSLTFEITFAIHHQQSTFF
jgi:hypothetical protein